MNKIFFLLLAGSLAFVSCKDDDIPELNVPGLTAAGKAQLTQDSLAIVQYLNDNNIVPEFLDESGVFIKITEENGNTERPNLNNNVRVEYKGYKLNGAIFDENTDGVTFPLSDLILGWQIGIPYLGKGEKGQLFIPSYLAYGNNPPPNSIITANEPLIFDITLVDF